MDAHWLIETERLSLRPWRDEPEDVDRLHRIFGDPIAMEFYGEAFSREITRGWIQTQIEAYARNGCGLWAVFERAPQGPRFVGQCGVWFHEVAGKQQHELGWHVLRSRWREGLASEAGAAARDHAFGTMGLDRVVSWMTPDNVASRGVAEKIGMQLLGPAQHAIVGPMVVYGLDRALAGTG